MPIRRPVRLVADQLDHAITRPHPVQRGVDIAGARWGDGDHAALAIVH